MMRNYKKMIACLIICSLILVSPLSFLTIKISATDSEGVKEDLKLSNFKKGNVYVLVPSEKSVDVLKVTSWQSPEEFIRNTEKYKNENIPNDTVVQSKKLVEKDFSSITNSSISRSQYNFNSTKLSVALVVL